MYILFFQIEKKFEKLVVGLLPVDLKQWMMAMDVLVHYI